MRRARDNRGAARSALAAAQRFERQRRPGIRSCPSPLAASSSSQLRRGQQLGRAPPSPYSYTGGRAAHCACGASASWERGSVTAGGAAEVPRPVPSPIGLAFTAGFTAGFFLIAAAVAPAIWVTAKG